MWHLTFTHVLTITSRNGSKGNLSRVVKSLPSIGRKIENGSVHRVFKCKNSSKKKKKKELTILCRRLLLLLLSGTSLYAIPFP